MNTGLRASAMAAALLQAGLMPPPLHAEQCRIGPAAFEAPACIVKETSAGEEAERYAEWSEDGRVYTVAVIAAKKPRPFRGYLARWRHNHKCTAEEISLGRNLSIEGIKSAGKREVPPQITWKGACAAPEKYMVRAIGLKRQVVELHVTQPLSPAPLETAMAAFLDRVRLYPTD